VESTGTSTIQRAQTCHHETHYEFGLLKEALRVGDSSQTMMSRPWWHSGSAGAQRFLYRGDPLAGVPKRCLSHGAIFNNLYSFTRWGSLVSIVSGYGQDDQAIDVRSLAEAKRFFL
jgi:hypothetical protein